MSFKHERIDFLLDVLHRQRLVRLRVAMEQEVVQEGRAPRGLEVALLEQLSTTFNDVTGELCDESVS